MAEIEGSGEEGNWVVLCDGELLREVVLVELELKPEDEDEEPVILMIVNAGLAFPESP